MEARRTPYTRFGRQLRSELDAQGVSIRELARRINRHDPEAARRSIARWLSAEPKPKSADPSATSRRVVAAALGLAEDAFDAEGDSDMPLSREEQAQFFSLLGKAMGARA